MRPNVLQKYRRTFSTFLHCAQIAETTLPHQAMPLSFRVFLCERFKRGRGSGFYKYGPFLRGGGIIDTRFQPNRIFLVDQNCYWPIRIVLLVVSSRRALRRYACAASGSKRSCESCPAINVTLPCKSEAPIHSNNSNNRVFGLTDFLYA